MKTQKDIFQSAGAVARDENKLAILAKTGINGATTLVVVVVSAVMLAALDGHHEAVLHVNPLPRS